MNLRYTLAALAATVCVAAQADVPPVDRIGKPAVVRCKTVAGGGVIFAVHADKIIFDLTGPLQAADPADQPELDQVPRNSPLDIKVLDDPKTVADLKGKVLSFIGAADTPAARQQVRIIDVDYAMVCPNVQQVPAN